MIGLFGGTFDPIHLGHIQLAKALLNSNLDIEKIHLVPCNMPAHRAQPEASATDRLKLVETATQNEAKLLADPREIKRDGISYTIDTLNSLQSDYDNQNIALILGFDAWEHFSSWESSNEILNNFHIIIANRPHYHLADKALIEAHQATIHIFTEPNFNISATTLREALQTDSPLLNDWLNPQCLAYIREHGLYQ